MKTLKFARFALLAATGLASLTVSAQVPKQGPVDWTLCFGGTVNALAASPQDHFGTYAVTGALRAASGLVESMSLDCTGSFEHRAGAGKHQGYCIFLDSAGDRVFGADRRGPQGYEFEFIGGTGKYAGITGGGNIEPLAELKPVRDGTMQACRRMRGNYKLP